MIDTLKFYKLMTLDEAFDKYEMLKHEWIIILHESTFGEFINAYENHGWRIQ